MRESDCSHYGSNDGDCLSNACLGCLIKYRAAFDFLRHAISAPEARQLEVAGCSACGRTHCVLALVPGSFVCPTNGTSVHVAPASLPAPAKDEVREAAERLWYSLTPPRSTTDDGMLLVRAEDVEAVLRAFAPRGGE